jgi:EAL domain-containing protein (putative c-di-GMP-specific phosphodiesterase class I)
VWPADGEDPVTLLRNADVAMYRAKAHKDRFEFYATDLSVQAAVRLNLERELRRALDRGELRLFYQPIISMASGEVVALEALIRWQHPTRGLLAPSEFLWRAEETGLIDPIGRWALEEACGQARRWTSSRPAGSIQVSVNLSARQLLHPSLGEEVGHILERTGLHPDALILEISEEAVMRDLLGNVAMLHELKALGVLLALDDFGTGSTALSHLGRFPLDIVKIDRIFVDGVDTSSEHAVIVGAMLSLAEALGLAVVAEGVETPGQLRALRSHGCDLVQGFLFSRPVPPAGVPSLLASPSWVDAVAG